MLAILHVALRIKLLAVCTVPISYDLLVVQSNSIQQYCIVFRLILLRICAVVASVPSMYTKQPTRLLLRHYEQYSSKAHNI